MSIAEIRKSIDQMNDDERFFAAAYLQHLSQERDPAYQALLAQRLERIEPGKKVTLEQAARVHSKQAPTHETNGHRRRSRQFH